MIQKPLVLLYEKILAIFQVKKVANFKKKIIGVIWDFQSELLADNLTKSALLLENRPWNKYHHDGWWTSRGENPSLLILSSSLIAWT